MLGSLSRQPQWVGSPPERGAGRSMSSIFGETAEKRYGAPYLLAHRGDLRAALATVVPDSVLRLDHQLVSIEQRADGSIRLDFANGMRADANAVVGADGVHSVVRDTLLGGLTLRRCTWKLSVNGLVSKNQQDFAFKG